MRLTSLATFICIATGRHAEWVMPIIGEQ